MKIVSGNYSVKQLFCEITKFEHLKSNHALKFTKGLEAYASTQRST